MQYDGMFRKDSPGGKEALEQLKGLRVLDVFEAPLMPAIPANVKWKCIEELRNIGNQIGNDMLTLSGEYCGVPLCKVEIRVEKEVVTLKVRG